jgi:hypothetical protein
MAISASTVRIIKLRNESDEIRTLEMEEVILDCRDVPAELADSGDLDEIVQHLRTFGYSAEAASIAARETRDFYSLGSDCLWIAVARGHLWWTFAARQVVWLSYELVLTGDRVRKSIGGWKSTDVLGTGLKLESFSEPLRQILRGDRDSPLDEFLPELLAVINGGLSPQHTQTQESARIQVPSELLQVGDIMARPSAAPDEPGLYAWWFDHLPAVPLDGALEQNGFKLAYVGIASHRLGSRRTLRQRLRNHCAGPIATSTLRRSLAAILRDKLGLSPALGSAGKIKLPKQEEKRLSDWLATHGRVAWIRNATPWVHEETLLRHGPRLALNIRGNTHEFVPELVALRAQFVDIAKAGARSC